MHSRHSKAKHTIERINGVCFRFTPASLTVILSIVIIANYNKCFMFLIMYKHELWTHCWTSRGSINLEVRLFWVEWLKLENWKKHLYRVSCEKKISAINYWAKSNLKFVSIYNKKLGLANSNPILKSDHSITSIISVHH